MNTYTSATTTQAVLYEGLRMRPVTTGQQAKEVPAGGDTIGGRFVPGGTSIATNFGAILRSARLFGADADAFRPERFLGLPAPAALVEMRRNVELAFGHGRYMCAGKPLAFMEFNKIYFQVSSWVFRCWPETCASVLWLGWLRGAVVE